VGIYLNITALPSLTSRYSVFPIRYYIIDFELSVRFAEDSTPDQRVVKGLPLLRNGYDHPDDYGGHISPETLLDAPHCPFKSDVFQLGKVFFTYFHASYIQYLPSNN
jgi:hypothetical protein